MRVLVVGGGIGGLTTAIALRHQGIDALVLEQAQRASTRSPAVVSTLLANPRLSRWSKLDSFAR